MIRRRRWIRGDWQIARWLLRKVPAAGGLSIAAQGQSVSNPLGLMPKWLIFDNLRRSVLPAALLAALLFGWFAFPDDAQIWTLSLLATCFLPNLAQAAVALAARSRHVRWRAHLLNFLHKQAETWTIEGLELAFLPFQSALYLDAILRTLWRLWVSHRRLLEWQTALEAERRGRLGCGATLAQMWPAPVIALLAGAAAIHVGAVGGVLVPAVLLAWFGAPFLAWGISRPQKRRAAPLTAAQTLFLGKLARRTWGYFEHFVVAEQSWLPADNFQETPEPKIAGRTSPTNIAMGLLSNLAAFDLGYASGRRVLESTARTFETMEKLGRYRGHFYNWYGTRTLQPLTPLYVSVVDSGNLTAGLLTLKAGLRELQRGPILSERWRRGIQETALVVLEEIAAVVRAGSTNSPPAVLQSIQQTLREQFTAPVGIPGSLSAVRQALDDCAATLARVEPGAAAWDGVAFWLSALRRQCQDLREDLVHLAPWLTMPALGAEFDSVRAALEGVPRLDELLTLERRLEPALKGIAARTGSDNGTLEALRQHLAAAVEHATRRFEETESLARRCEEFAEADLDFLYDPARGLLVIGFNLDSHQSDRSFFDLLASEARLGSFTGVALGLLPAEHWFRLGRPLAPGEGPATLMSWGGSLFEYLMPPLIMPTFEGTLLDEMIHGAVFRQMEYGRAQGIPWGVSESCFNGAQPSERLSVSLVRCPGNRVQARPDGRPGRGAVCRSAGVDGGAA